MKAQFSLLSAGVPGTGGALAVRGSANSTQASFSDNTSGTFRIATASGALNLLLVESGQSIVFGIGNNSGLSSEYLRITSAGNVKIASGVIENAKTISSNYTVSTNYNAMSAGPMSIANGVSVTVPSGSAWTIV